MSELADWINRAGALLGASRFVDAAAACDRALALAPGDVRALNNKGVALNALNRPAEALACFDAVLAAEPDRAHTLVNRGAALQALGRLDEAIGEIDRALALDPNNGEAHYYRALALAPMNRRVEALASFDQALRVAPGDPDYLYSKGVALLGFGAWREAWPLFEQRWRAKRVRAPQAHDSGEPVWNGGAVDGLLRIWAEQGVGDQVLLASLLPLARERTQRIAVDCDKRLAPLFRRSFAWLDDVGGATAAAQCSLGGLGGMLGVTPELVGKAPYLIAHDALRVATRQRYEALANGRKIVGVAWFSENAEFGRYKSSTLAEWGALLARDFFFVNAQYHADRQEIAAAETQFDCVIHTDLMVDQTKDLDAFAAQIAALDHMISVSNSGVHIAGALGAPCTLLAPPGRGLLWYWGMEGETTPWYRSVRIVRRRAGEPWSRSIEEAAELAAQ